VAAIALAALLFALGAGGFSFQLALSSLLPSPLDWEAAAALLERDARPGDAVLISPTWAERIRELAPRGMPVLANPPSAPGELEGVRRVWLLSLPRAPFFSYRPELDLLARSSAPEPPLALGRLTLSRYEITHPDLPLATLAERLPVAKAWLADHPCTSDRGGFRCTSERAEVSLESGVVEVNGLSRSCLLARASGNGGALSVVFPGVPVGRTLRVNAALVPGGDAPPSVPLAVVVRVDGEEAAAVQLEGAGWPAFRVDTGRWAGQRHSVALEFVVPENRALCLQAVTLP